MPKSIQNADVYREAGGRKYQAQNEYYVLPADEQEMRRLDDQHLGFKARQGGVNYLAPVKEVLGQDGSGKRILDVGTGNGVWAIETAREFPGAEVIVGNSNARGDGNPLTSKGSDLAAVQRKVGIPANCRFEIHDAIKGLPFPHCTFDVVHARLLIIGIQDWRSLINDIIRVLKPGGLVVLVEMGARFSAGDDLTVDQQKAIAPGFTRFADHFDMAVTNRGLDPVAGSMTIPSVLSRHSEITGAVKQYVPLPLWPWSDDPILKEAGRVLVPDTSTFPELLRVLIAEGCQLSAEAYAPLAEGFREDFGRPDVHAVWPIWHNWAFKKEPE